MLIFSGERSKSRSQRRRERKILIEEPSIAIEWGAGLATADNAEDQGSNIDKRFNELFPDKIRQNAFSCILGGIEEEKYAPVHSTELNFCKMFFKDLSQFLDITEHNEKVSEPLIPILKR